MSLTKTWTDCPTCHYPLLGERCDNPGCSASGNVPPEILERRAKEEAETAERSRFATITATSYGPTTPASNKHRGDLLRVSREQLQPEGEESAPPVVTLKVELANKIEGGRAVGNLYGVGKYSPDGRRLGWHLQPQEDEALARGIVLDAQYDALCAKRQDQTDDRVLEASRRALEEVTTTPDPFLIPADVLQEALAEACASNVARTLCDGSAEPWSKPGSWFHIPAEPGHLDIWFARAVVHPDQTIEYLHRNPDGSLHHITTEH